jgi:RNA polymerase sigma factor (sigma-70 family)
VVNLWRLPPDSSSSNEREDELGADFDTVLLAARTGSDWAWSSLYREYSPALLRYLRAGGAADPEDVLGEVFVKVVLKLCAFHGCESEFKAWIFTIARHRLIDEARRRRPFRWPASHDLGPGAEPGADPSRLIADREVTRVLDHVTPEQRDVLFLRVLAGLSVEETAQVLGKTSGSVKRLQARGLRSLRQKILRGAVSI